MISKVRLSKNLSNLNVLIVCHTYVKGALHELEDYLVKNKVKTLVFIGHPFGYYRRLYGMKTNSHIRVHCMGDLVYSHEAIDWKLPELLMYIKDVVYTIYWVLTSHIKFDIMFGGDCLNALTCLFLKFLGKGKMVSFYTIDYFKKNRFKNRVLDTMYFLMDKICVKKSDWVWNVSSRIVKGREEKGISPKYRMKQLTVPIGIKFDETRRISFNGIDRYKIVFLGSIQKRAGISLLIDSIPEIIAQVPQAHFLFIGGGDYEGEAKRLISQKGIQDKVEFKGVVTNREYLEKLLSTCALGVAPYEPSPDNHTYFADPTKPKDYMAFGLPTIITKVPQIAQEIDNRKAGFAIDYNKEEFVKAVVRLLIDDKLYKEFRENVFNLAREYSWDKIFDEAISQTLEV